MSDKLLKYFFVLAVPYFLIAGDGMAALFCVSAYAIADLENRIEALEKRVCAAPESVRNEVCKDTSEQN